MEFLEFIEFAKVAYHLYLTDTLEECEMIEYLWDAECDVITYGIEELVVSYFEEGDPFPSKITISPSLDVVVETDLEGDGY